MKNRAGAIAVAAVVLAFMITLLAADLLGGAAILNTVMSEGGAEKSYYIVAIGGYQSYNLAKEDAELFRGMGAAGFIAREGEEFFVALSAYASKADADSVAGKNSGATVKEITLPLPELKGISDKSAAEEALKYFEKAFAAFSAVAHKIDAGELGIDEAKNKIKALYDEIENIKRDFEQKTASDTSSAATEIKLAIITVLGISKNVLDGGFNPVALAADLRYYSVQILILHKKLLQSL
ncbi:MAG TPA: hypothetical protein P5161_01815 [Eubacteriales bacterium]|nr:hypothetical protein [Eubacteriales bacterium]HRU85007.1 hypothetical protein [Eubacteriales bacterium]